MGGIFLTSQASLMLPSLVEWNPRTKAVRWVMPATFKKVIYKTASQARSLMRVYSPPVIKALKILFKPRIKVLRVKLTQTIRREILLSIITLHTTIIKIIILISIIVLPSMITSTHPVTR